MTAETLNRYSAKHLAAMARSRGVRGWHSMRKDQLVRALLRLTKQKSGGSTKNGRRAPTTKPVPSRRKAPPSVPQDTATRKVRKLEIVRRIEEVRARLDRLKNLSSPDDGAPGRKPVRDRIVLLVRDPFWLHAFWELSKQGVERAQAAMGQDWHMARPVLRLFEVHEHGSTSSAESISRDVEIHGGVNNWYLDVKDPPKSYRVEVGYKAANGRFYALARSNVVATPPAGQKDAVDRNWVDVAADSERIFALSGGNGEARSVDLQEVFEERLRRPMGSPLTARVGAGVEGLLPKSKGFSFELDAELLVYGATDADARVTLQGEPVKLRPDGTFAVRFRMPNCRQVIPAVAASANGLESRTIVLAVERNTKTMEPMVREQNE